MNDPSPGAMPFVFYAHEVDRPVDQPVVGRHAYDLTITLVPAAGP